MSIAMFHRFFPSAAGPSTPVPASCRPAEPRHPARPGGGRRRAASRAAAALLRVGACTALLAMGAQGQSVLTGYTGPTTNPIVRQLFFDVTVPFGGITVKSFDLNLRNPAGTVGTVQVQWCLPGYAPNVAVPLAWAGPAATVTAAGPGNATHVCFLPAGMPMTAGLHGVCLTFTGVDPLYTSVAPLTVFSGGFPVVAVTPGDANTGLFAGPLPHVPPPNPWAFDGQMYFEYGAGPLACPGGCANRVRSGVGCYSHELSFYEDDSQTGGLAAFGFAGAPNNVQAITLTAMTPPPLGYQVSTAGNARWQTPTNVVTSQNGGGAMGDDDYSIPYTLPIDTSTSQPFAFPYPDGFGGLATTTQIQVSSNGYVILAPTALLTNQAPYSLVAARDFLAGAPCYAPLWADVDPTVNLGGNVYFDVSGSFAYVTWLNVGMWTSPANAVSLNFQIELDLVTGNVEYRYQTMAGLGYLAPQRTINPLLVGWTQGGGALDPRHKVLAAELPFDRWNPEGAPLRIDANFPVNGEPLVVTTSNVPACAVAVFTFIGFARLGPIDLTSFFGPGEPGCNAYCQPDLSLIGFYTGVPLSQTFGVIPPLCGLGFCIQSAALTTPGCVNNSFNIVTSDVLDMTIGS